MLIWVEKLSKSVSEKKFSEKINETTSENFRVNFFEKIFAKNYFGFTNRKTIRKIFSNNFSSISHEKFFSRKEFRDSKTKRIFVKNISKKYFCTKTVGVVIAQPVAIVSKICAPCVCSLIHNTIQSGNKGVIK